MSFQKNYDMLKFACDTLGELTDEVVFVGGATTCLYVNPSIAGDIRPTEDVDCVIEIATKKEYDQFQSKLRAKGFTHDLSKGAPLCRFVFHDLLTLDVMPNEEKILGFTNSWYSEGIKHKEIKNLEGKKIFVFTLPHFLASKYEAYLGRGQSDPRLSSDLEDIAIVIDGIVDFNLDNFSVSDKLRDYLSLMGKECISNKYIQEAFEGFFYNQPEKIKKLNTRLNSI